MSPPTHSGTDSERHRRIVLDSSEGSDTELLGISDDSDINLSGFDEVSSSSDGRSSSYMSNTVTQVSASSSTDGLDLFDSESVRCSGKCSVTYTPAVPRRGTCVRNPCKSATLVPSHPARELRS
jgi:hypothetical protein